LEVVGLVEVEMVLLLVEEVMEEEVMEEGVMEGGVMEEGVMEEGVMEEGGVDWVMEEEAMEEAMEEGVMEKELKGSNLPRQAGPHSHSISFHSEHRKSENSTDQLLPIRQP